MTDSPILFLGHAADRTGPPIYLLHFLRWLRAHRPEVEFEIALLSGGELLDDFRALAPTSVYEGLPPGPWDGLERHLLAGHDPEVAAWWWATRRERQLREQMRQHGHCRLVYVSGAPSIELARLLPPGERTILSHVHELEVGLAHRLQDHDRELLLEGAARIFVPAMAVSDHLVRRYQVDPATVELHQGMVEDASVTRTTSSPAERRSARLTRGLPVEGWIVGSCGSIEWRKATDLFLRMAWQLKRATLPEPVTFVWVGGAPDDIARAETQARIYGLEEAVHFVGVQSDPSAWFGLMDVFVLPAREDPFPLVCLEALATGCPVVAFDNGGMPELLTLGCGEVVTYPDVAALSGAVEGLLRDEERRRSMGDRGQTLVRDRHDVLVLAPRLWASIEPWL